MNIYRIILSIITIFITVSVSGNASFEVKKFGIIEMVYIPAGSFIMGSPESEDKRETEEVQHRVEVSAFWMGRYEVMQEEYELIMGENTSKYYDNPRNPVDQVSWYEAVEFCNRLSIKQGLKPYYYIDKKRKDPVNFCEDDYVKFTIKIRGGNGFRLPTEAEWEYACRSGTSTAFYYGEHINSTIVNFKENVLNNRGKEICRFKPTSVGNFEPNFWGLYDMHGNVWELCFDWYDENYYGKSPSKDPVNLSGGKYRVMRGGSWINEAHALRSAARNYTGEDWRDYLIGFRIVRSIK